MPISAEELLSVVRKYWRSDHGFDGKLESSPELMRFQALWKQEFEKLEQWRVLMRELRAVLPQFEIGHATATSTSCFRCTVFTNRQPVEASHEDGPRERRWGVVGCLSILAPVYTVYGLQYDYTGQDVIAAKVFFDPLPPEMQALAEVVGRKIEAMFGAEALPRELAETRIPLIVEFLEPPATTLFHALFSTDPENVAV
ncbi:hypothetical protein [Archangium gephyra]|nr:hypothetical protein [Archangium gephyra]